MNLFKWILLILLLSSCYNSPTCFSLSETTYTLSLNKVQSLPPCLLKINQEYTIHIKSLFHNEMRPLVNPLKFKLDKTHHQMIITTEDKIQRLEASEEDMSFNFEVTNRNYKFSFQAKLDASHNCFITMSISRTQSLRSLSQCPTGFFLNDGACSRVCPLNNYRDGGYCFKCDGNCSTCLSQNTCNPCVGRQSFFEEENICVDKCPENYFNDYNNALCVKCAEGCTTCSFPNGLCTTNYFKTDMIINLIVSSVLFGLVVLCACFCNQEKEENSTQEQQAEQNDQAEVPVPQKGQDQHIQQIIDGKPGGQYNILPEEFDLQGGNLEDDDGPLPSRRAKKRLTDFAQKKLLRVSMSKPFIIDDGNEEKAISHDSASKLFSKRSFSPLFVSKSDISPTLLKGSKFNLESDEGSRPNLQSFQNLEDQNAKKLIFDVSDSTPTNKGAGPDRTAALFLLATKETSLGKKVNNQEEEDLDNDISLHLNQENDFGEIIYEESSKEGGYQQDSSMNASKDKDESLDYHACTICGLNRRDCMNKPCGHTVACYACMEQFREQYGVCPKCQRLLSGLTKMQRGKKL